MIITKVKISSFGCITNKEIEFVEGLNVVLGNNETGKSTLYNAIENVLFVPSNLNKKVDNRLKRFLPVGGGDTIDTTLWFKDDENKEYSIARIWGTGNSNKNELILHDKSTLTDYKKIQEKLNTLLPAKEATVKSVLMTYQSGLFETIQHIGNETINDLGILLRNAIMTNFSIEAFKTKLDELCDSYYSKWDSTLDKPEADRGINNPWIKQVGIILQAYYEKERVKKDYDEAKSYENTLDTLTTKLDKHKEDMKQTDDYLNKNKQAFESAEGLEKINLNINNTEHEIKQLNTDYNNWILIEKENENINKQIPNIENEIKELNDKQNVAKKQEENRKLKERFDNINKTKKSLEEKNNQLKSIPKIDKEVLKQIRDAIQKIKTTEASIKAGKINIEINAKKDFNLSIKNDLSEQSKIAITTNEKFITTANGIVNLEHDDFYMQVTSGDGNIGQLVEQYEEEKVQLENLLKKYGLKDIKEAEEKNTQYEQINNEIQRLTKNLQEQLGTDSYEQLQERINQIPLLNETIDLENTIKVLTTKKLEKENLTTKQRENQERLKELTDKYETKDNLQKKIAEKLNTKKSFTEAQTKNKELLKDIKDVEGFIKEYNSKKELLQKQKDEETNVKLEIAQLKKPEQSIEELIKQLEEKEKNFETKKLEGKAIQKVKEAAKQILEQIDKNPYYALKNKFIEYMKKLTDNKYNDANFKDCISETFKNQNNLGFTYQLLSAGTKDTISLALRLAMADYFLAKSKGFLIMDDPLVNLDPQRQQKAVNVLKEFAKNKQIILFTCHPSHADNLVGKQNCINL